MLGSAQVLHGETRFYTGLRDKSTLEAPRGYWGKVDSVSWRSIAVLEDIVATKGAKFWEPTNAFTREQITDLVGELARLHAPLWGGPAIVDLNTPADYIANTSAFLDIRKRCEVGMRRARDVIPPRLSAGTIDFSRRPCARWISPPITCHALCCTVTVTRARLM